MDGLGLPQGTSEATIEKLAQHAPLGADDGGPHAGDEVIFSDGTDAEATLIEHVWNPGCVNLSNGKTSVPLVRPGQPRPGAYFCYYLEEGDAVFGLSQSDPPPPQGTDPVDPPNPVRTIEAARALPEFELHTSDMARPKLFECQDERAIRAFKDTDGRTMEVVIVGGSALAKFDPRNARGRPTVL